MKNFEIREAGRPAKSLTITITVACREAEIVPAPFVSSALPKGMIIKASGCDLEAIVDQLVIEFGKERLIELINED